MLSFFPKLRVGSFVLSYALFCFLHGKIGVFLLSELFLAELLHHFNSAQITLVKIVFWSVGSFVLSYCVLGHFVLSYGSARPG